MSRRIPLSLVTSLAAFAALPSSLAFADGFGDSRVSHNLFSLGDELPLTGDFNGDGKDDVVTFLRSSRPDAIGDVWVALSNGTAFNASSRWHEMFSIDQEVPLVGDFNGDGKDDVASFTRSDASTPAGDGDVWVAVSNGSAFVSSSKWHTNFCVGQQLCRVGDVNGDGRDDILAFVRSTGSPPSGHGDVWVALSSGSSFGAPTVWHDGFSFHQEIPLVGDVNADGKDDLVTLVRSTDVEPHRGDVWVSLSNGSGFGASSRWHVSFCLGDGQPLLGDVTGDNRADLVCFVRSSQSGDSRGDVLVSRSSGSAFGGSQRWHEYFGIGQEVPALGDFNFDGRDDIAAFKQDTSGQPGYADVVVALTGEPSLPKPAAMLAEFGWQGMRNDNKPALGQRWLATLLVDFSDVPMNHSQAHFAQLFFGPAPRTVSGYFSAVSNGLFTFAEAGSVGPVRFRDDPSTPNVDESRRACALGNQTLCPGSAVDGPEEFVTRVLALAATHGFDFASFDANADGDVTDSELQVVIINAVPPSPVDTWGVNRTPAGGCVNLQVKDVCLHVPSVTEFAGFATIVHEIAHTLGTHDIYGPGYANRASLMAATVSSSVNDETWSVELDAWHKLRLGWIRPAIYDLADPGSCQQLSDAYQRGSALLFDSRRGTDEFFLLEFRNKASLYDGDTKESGVAVWNVTQTENHDMAWVTGRRIVAGNDGVLQSARVGDDVIVGTTIRPGPDGLLQSQPSGDDVIGTDPGVLLQAVPAAPRSVVDFANAIDGIFDLRWKDGTATDLFLQIALPVLGQAHRTIKWSRYSFDVEPILYPTTALEACYGDF